MTRAFNSKKGYYLGVMVPSCNFMIASSWSRDTSTRLIGWSMPLIWYGLHPPFPIALLNLKPTPLRLQSADSLYFLCGLKPWSNISLSLWSNWRTNHARRRSVICLQCGVRRPLSWNSSGFFLSNWRLSQLDVNKKSRSSNKIQAKPFFKAKHLAKD